MKVVERNRGDRRRLTRLIAKESDTMQRKLVAKRVAGVSGAAGAGSCRLRRPQS